MPAVSKRAALAGLLLAWGAGVALQTTIWLSKQPGVPERWGVPALLFFVAFLLAVAAGWVRGTDADSPRPSAVPALDGRFRFARFAAAAVALGFFGWTWNLQNRADHPLSALATWTIALVAAVLAFPGVLGPGLRTQAPASRAQRVALAGIFLLAASARLVRLDLVHPVFSGDEATVAMDGRELLDRSGASDPFGAGANSSMRLGMLPAGAGATLFDSKIAGARRLYALIGTMSLVATAGAAWILAGPWAALGGLALIAFSPIHVHFSRSSNNVIVDSLLVTSGVFFVLALLRTGSPRSACLAGVFSGLSLYGYGGGRVMPVVLLASLPLVLWRFRAARGRPALLALAMVGGFLIAAGPNLHYASSHFDTWNGRFNQTSIFEPAWHRAEVARLGSEANLFLNQIRLGTIGLLSSPPLIDIFTGFPLISPAPLPALGIVGLGWLYGRRRFAEATIAGLVVAGNLAGVSFTVSTPQAHRASSLVPALAALGGVAVAGFLAALPERAKGVPWRSVVGSLLIGVLLARQVSGFPLDWSPYKNAGGGHAALAQSVWQFVEAPRYQRETLYFHGGRYVFWDFPSFRYLLPDRRVIDVAEEKPASFPPGLHVCSEEFLWIGQEWARTLGLPRGVRLAHPADPRRDVGFAFLVPPGKTRTLPASE